MDVVVLLASQVAGALAPYLPHLLNVGGNIIGGVAQEAEANSWNLAKGLWSKLRPKNEADPAAREVVRDVAAHPDEQDFQIALRVQIRKLLKDDPALTAEISRLVQSGKQQNTITTVTNYGSRSPTAGGDQNIGQYVGRDYNPTRSSRRDH